MCFDELITESGGLFGALDPDLRYSAGARDRALATLASARSLAHALAADRAADRRLRPLRSLDLRFSLRPADHDLGLRDLAPLGRPYASARAEHESPPAGARPVAGAGGERLLALEHLELLGWLVLFSLVLAPVERWLGSARTAFAFAAGHVGATLLTAAGLWLALRYEVVGTYITHAIDVGASYGFFAVAAVLVFRLSGRLRVLYLAVVIGYLVIAAR
ncbi:MAG: rhomboid-like protein [Gaiellaceae bacterium]